MLKRSRVGCVLRERFHADEKSATRSHSLAEQARTPRRAEGGASHLIAATRRGRIVERHAARLRARVSTIDQNLALQRDALAEAGCGRIFTEQLSGAVTDRPALHEALEFARSGDTLIVWKLDRLARSMKQLIETIEESRLARFARSRSDLLKHSAPGAVDRCGNSLGRAQVRCEITASVAVAGGMGKRR